MFGTSTLYRKFKYELMRIIMQHKPNWLIAMVVITVRVQSFAKNYLPNKNDVRRSIKSEPNPTAVAVNNVV